MSPKQPARKAKKPLERAPASRKLASSARARRKPRPFSTVLKVIEIQEGIPGQNTVHLRRHAATIAPDRVQWANLDDRGRTVVFVDGLWPFLEPPQEIRIRSHGCSPIFTVYIGAAMRGYAYVILPPEEQGPGEPQVVVDP